MKTVIVIIITLFLAHIVQAQNYKLVQDDSSLEWTGYGEIGGFSQTGTISAKGGYLSYQNNQLTAAKITVDMKTLKSKNKNVAQHLKNKDFFYVKKYPVASIELKKIVNDTVSALLNIRGISQDIRFPIETKTDGDIIVLRGTLMVDRTKHEIKYNSNSFFKGLGNQAIKNEFDLTFDLCFKLE